MKHYLHTFHSGLVGGDGGAFNSHIVLQSGQGRVDGDLVVSLITVRQTQVIILQLNVNIGQDELKEATKTKLASAFNYSIFNVVLFRKLYRSVEETTSNNIQLK